MAAHNQLGIKGEEIAVQFLATNNYQILETNWRWQKAEIDIIALYENMLIIVEVKTRSSAGIAAPEEAVTNKKQALLIDAAEAYCEQKAIDLELRFDVISIILTPHNQQIYHIEAAF